MVDWEIWVGAAAIFCAFVAICLVGSGLLTRGRAFPDPSFDALDTTRKTLAQVIGGAAVIFTFAWSFLKDSETLEQARQQNANQQYISAAQMLAPSQSVATRSAAIFSLGRLSTTRIEYSMPVRDAVAAFVMQDAEQHADVVSKAIAHWKDDAPVGIRHVSTDVQAALQVLGSRNLADDDPTRDLTLNGAYLVGGNFSQLSGFRNSWLQSAMLSATDFRGAHLEGTHFDGAHFSDWIGYGVEAWHDNVPDNPAWEQWLKYRFIANFQGAFLQGASFTGADISGAKFSDADIEGVDFSRANLSRADFRGARNIRKAIFNKSGPACADVPAKFDYGIGVQLPGCPHNKN